MTGEPYALIAHVRFGGRGDESHPYPYPLKIQLKSATLNSILTAH